MLVPCGEEAQKSECPKTSLQQVGSCEVARVLGIFENNFWTDLGRKDAGTQSCHSSQKPLEKEQEVKGC